MATKPQTLNPYPCGVNNPLAYPDPSGMFSPNLGGGGGGSAGSGDYYVNSPPNKTVGSGDCSEHIPGSAGAPNGDVAGTVRANITEARGHAFGSPWAAVNPFSEQTRESYSWFYSKVNDGEGDWDYNKYASDKEGDPVFESFSSLANFNFGAAGSAMNMPLAILFNGAGGAEAYKRLTDEVTDNPLSPFPDLSIPDSITSLAPYTWDQLDDQVQIAAGVNYYYCLQALGIE